MSPPTHAPPPLFPLDTLRDISEGLGQVPPSTSALNALASDVEYRLRTLVEDASKYMRHAKRSQLRVADVDRALRAWGEEPLYGHYSQPRGHSSLVAPAVPVYKRIQTASGPQYVLDDPEVSLEDIDTLLSRRAPLQRSLGVGWAAHWLAVEGVQPDIPQNPDRGKAGHLPLEEDAKTFSTLQLQAASNGAVATNGPGRVLSAVGPSTLASASASAFAAGASNVAGPSSIANVPQVRPLIKHVLSRELQLYFTRLTDAILSSPLPAALDASSAEAQEDAVSATDASSVDNPTRSAALSSLAGDAGLSQLLPYLIQWIGERIVDLLSASSHGLDAPNQHEETSDGQAGAQAKPVECQRALVGILGAIEAVLRNPTLVLEHYLHQLLPSILSVLLTSLLPSCLLLRAHAASLLRLLLSSYNTSYPSLKPRLIRTLSKCALLDSAHDKGAGHPIVTVQGALLGLQACGASCIRNTLLRSASDRLDKTKMEEGSDLSSPSMEEMSLLGKLGVALQSREADEKKVALGVVVQILLPLSPSDTAPATSSEQFELRRQIGSRHGQFWSDVFVPALDEDGGPRSMDVDGNVDAASFVEKDARSRIARLLAGPLDA